MSCGQAVRRLLQGLAAAGLSLHIGLTQAAVQVTDDRGRQVDLPALLQRLGDTGTRAVLLEGGGHLNGAMMAAGLVDHVLVFIAPKLAGEGATPIQGWSLGRMADAVSLQDMAVRPVGEDFLMSGRVGP